MVRLYDYGEFYVKRDERGRLSCSGLPLTQIERDGPSHEILALAIA